jgi:microcystin-dependent protein
VNTGGVTSVSLTPNQMPIHSHPAIGDINAANTTTGIPTNALYGNTAPAALYGTGAVARNVRAMMTLPSQGGSQPHDNMQPYLAITFIISMFGIYPSPT